MGNAGIIYDRGTTIDFGTAGVVSALPGTMVEGERLFWGTGQSVISYQGRTLRIQKGPFYNDQPLYRALSTFWGSWGSKGLPFAFAADLAKVGDTSLWTDARVGNLVTNGGLENWTGTDPDGVTITLSGATTITRETRYEDVRTGLYSLRYDRAAAAQSIARFETQRSIDLGWPFVVRFRYRTRTTGSRLEYAVQQVDDGFYAQDTNGSSWAAPAVYFNAGNTTTLDWHLHSQGFASGVANESVLRIYIRNGATGGTAYWLDDVEFTQSAPNYIYVRESIGFTTGDAVRLIARTGHREELTTVSGFVVQGDAAVRMTLGANTIGRWDARDILRSQDYFPHMVADQEDPAITEDTGSLFRFDLKCREALTGRV